MTNISNGAKENFPATNKITNLNDVEEIPTGSPLKLEVEFPNIDHPIYGKISGMRKEIQMVLPKG